MLDVRVERRCGQRWEDLDGGGRVVRRCAECETPVTNLSAMREDVARRYLATLEAPACVAYRARPDGEILFAREPALDLRALAVVAATSLATGCSIPPPGTPSRDAVSVAESTPEPVSVVAVASTAQLEPERRPPLPNPIDCALYDQLQTMGYLVGPDPCPDPPRPETTEGR